jgi:hypothetical protein
MKHVEVDDTGTVVSLSLLKTLMSTIWGIMFLALGAVCILGAFWTFLAALGLVPPAPENRIVVLLLAVFIGLLGLGAMVVGGLVASTDAINYLRQEHYIIGQTAVQRVYGDADVQDHIPFDNVREIRMATGELFNKNKYSFIAVDLVDPRRKDTKLSSKQRRDTRKVHKCDWAIMDFYELPIEEFCRKLRKRWKNPGKEERRSVEVEEKEDQLEEG